MSLAVLPFYFFEIIVIPAVLNLFVFLDVMVIFTKRMAQFFKIKFNVFKLLFPVLALPPHLHSDICNYLQVSNSVYILIGSLT